MKPGTLIKMTCVLSTFEPCYNKQIIPSKPFKPNEILILLKTEPLNDFRRLNLYYLMNKDGLIQAVSLPPDKNFWCKILC